MTATTVASIGLLVAGLATVAGLSQVGSGTATTTTAVSTTSGDTTDAPGTTGGLTTTPLVSAPTTAATTTTTNPGFASGAAASAAAEDLLVGYIASQHDVDVTDPACSEPPTGAVGETFACYALKPGDLVIALRATIGEERLVTLELITNQTPPTTTTTVAESSETTEA